MYVRLSDVKRSFGNKKTWDTPFETHFRAFVQEANSAVFKNGTQCHVLNSDAASIVNTNDLVYIDTPYVNNKGVGVDYADFYHFLDGLINYDNWASLIDYNSKHHRLKRTYNIWTDKENILNGFEQLINQFKEGILVFSYRSNGIPSIETLDRLVRKARERKPVTLLKRDEIRTERHHDERGPHNFLLEMSFMGSGPLQYCFFERKS